MDSSFINCCGRGEAGLPLYEGGRSSNSIDVEAIFLVAANDGDDEEDEDEVRISASENQDSCRVGYLSLS